MMNHLPAKTTNFFGDDPDFLAKSSPPALGRFTFGWVLLKAGRQTVSNYPSHRFP
jgi:hypothetical protein